MEKKIYAECKYVLHLHEAFRAGRHYDFRCQIPPKKKQLGSWAIPKARIPQNPGNRELAIRTPDHGALWLNFHGHIDAGQYGGGKVSILQKGTLDVEGWSDKYITFYIHHGDGKYMKGRYALIKMKERPKKKGNEWVIIKLKEKVEESIEESTTNMNNMIGKFLFS